jgi:hypothetical protein
MASKVDQMTHATRMASVLVRPVRKAIARRNPVMFWQTSAPPRLRSGDNVVEPLAFPGSRLIGQMGLKAKTPFQWTQGDLP